MKWIKPSGTEIETNDREETVAACEAMGWKKKSAAKPKAKTAKSEATDD